MIEWHKGPPPEIGWWPATVFKSDDSFRWWDGKHWSVAAQKHYTSEEAAEVASRKCVYPNRDVLWTERWWLK